VKRINFKFLLILIVVAVVTFGGLFLLRRFQINRNAGGKLEIARQKLEEGKTAQAMEIFAQYVGLRPNDNEAFAEYSKLLLGRATAPDATRNDVARAFNSPEWPDSLPIRRMASVSIAASSRFSRMCSTGPEISFRSAPSGSAQHPIGVISVGIWSASTPVATKKPMLR